MRRHFFQQKRRKKLSLTSNQTSVNKKTALL
jgi:hypothetical protein